MAKGDPLLSPYVWDSGADSQGRHITITIPFNNSTRAILNGIVVHRDAGCTYTRIVIGVPSDPSSRRTASVPNGDTTFTANQFRNATGFTTIDQVLDLQITAEA
jgi:hypothetical protein